MLGKLSLSLYALTNFISEDITKTFPKFICGSIAFYSVESRDEDACLL